MVTQNLEQVIRCNINSCISKWHVNFTDGSMAPLVCLICDRFIIPDSNKVFSLEKLNNYQQLFHPDPSFELSDALKECYRIQLPNIQHIPLQIQETLQIENCLLSPRSCYVTNSDGEEGYNICHQCHQSVSFGHRPKFCMANNYCFGSPPPCLTSLTAIERAVITPVKTFGYCFSYTGGQHIELQGSLSYYKRSTDHIVQAIGFPTTFHHHLTLT